MYTSAMISDLIKEDGYSVSGSAAAQLEEGHGIGTGFNDDDDETLYGFDKETETIINLESGELVRSLSHLTTTTSTTSSSECTEGTDDDNSELGYDVEDDSS